MTDALSGMDATGLGRITPYLDPREVCRLSLTCKALLKTIGENEAIWKEIAWRYYSPKELEETPLTLAGFRVLLQTMQTECTCDHPPHSLGTFYDGFSLSIDQADNTRLVWNRQVYWQANNGDQVRAFTYALLKNGSLDVLVFGKTETTFHLSRVHANGSVEKNQEITLADHRLGTLSDSWALEISQCVDDRLRWYNRDQLKQTEWFKKVTPEHLNPPPPTFSSTKLVLASLLLVGLTCILWRCRVPIQQKLGSWIQ